MKRKPRRIYIVGMSASGKSTLAQLISVKLDCKYLALDSVYWDLKNTQPDKQVLRSRELREKMLDKLVRREHWVVDGIYLDKKVFDEADVIVFLKQSLIRSLFWQWKRYFSDPIQQEVYGLKNNLNLTKIIFLQHNVSIEGFDFDGYHYSTMRTLKNYLTEYYKDKLLICNGTNYKPILEKLDIMQS